MPAYGVDHSRPSPFRLGKFAAVGALGFAVDATMLVTLVHGFGWSHYAGRAVSFAAAVTVTWLCNRTWVFATTADRTREYGAYFAVQLAGAGINLGMYVASIAALPTLARWPVIPLAVGAAIALVFNYTAASRWVFASSAPPSIETTE